VEIVILASLVRSGARRLLREDEGIIVVLRVRTVDFIRAVGAIIHAVAPPPQRNALAVLAGQHPGLARRLQSAPLVTSHLIGRVARQSLGHCSLAGLRGSLSLSYSLALCDDLLTKGDGVEEGVVQFHSSLPSLQSSSPSHLHDMNMHMPSWH